MMKNRPVSVKLPFTGINQTTSAQTAVDKSETVSRILPSIEVDNRNIGTCLNSGNFRLLDRC